MHRDDFIVTFPLQDETHIILLPQGTRKTVTYMSLTIGIEKYHPKCHKNRVPVELDVRIGAPRKTATIVSSPDSHQDHSHCSNTFSHAKGRNEAFQMLLWHLHSTCSMHTFNTYKTDNDKTALCSPIEHSYLVDLGIRLGGSKR